MPDAPIALRRATPDDAGVLAALAERTFRDTFGADNAAHDLEAYVREAFAPDRVRAELDDASNAFLLAVLDGAASLAGYAKLRAVPPHPRVAGPAPVELQRLYVAQQAIGHGVGAALMRASLDVAGEAGHETLWLGVWERNARAIAFYERWGFETVGDHVFRLGTDPQRDLVMARPVATAL